MVLIYEAQFPGQQMISPDSMGKNMRLVYLDPTISSQHTLLSFNDAGSKLGEALQNDKKLQQLAARHGFRPNQPGIFATELSSAGIAPPPELLSTVTPPDYDRLEQLIEGVSAQFASSAPPEGAPEQ
ncbi:hypothetical protein [Corynebacterium epidermidicanis]|uniref:Uncharacterized protein n=1 Tax=Corynebacterium epidermidicanis TaxID=1050174 RepID=A0A0G3GU00_9CORY|nr:hypothetical protein [Corynebacterium epidermidicanis]AKK03038.1 hypothetical protein CEPID_05870 [Corynebacterium epidermidicanis]